MCLKPPFPLLPLGFLATQELLQDRNPFLQSLHFLLEGGLHLCAVVAQLGVEVLPVRGRGHRSTENRLDHKRVVRLQGVSVRLAEGLGQLLASVVDVMPESLGGEVQTTAIAIKQKPPVSAFVSLSH